MAQIFQVCPILTTKRHQKTVFFKKIKMKKITPHQLFTVLTQVRSGLGTPTDLVHCHLQALILV